MSKRETLFNERMKTLGDLQKKIEKASQSGNKAELEKLMDQMSQFIKDSPNYLEASESSGAEVISKAKATGLSPALIVTGAALAAVAAGFWLTRQHKDKTPSTIVHDAGSADALHDVALSQLPAR